MLKKPPGWRLKFPRSEVFASNWYTTSCWGNDDAAFRMTTLCRAAAWPSFTADEAVSSVAVY